MTHGPVLPDREADPGDLPPMRIRHGRVMHRVERRGSEYRSLCRKPHPVRGVHSTIPRAQGPEDWWDTERYDYSDCSHCPRELP